MMEKSLALLAHWMPFLFGIGFIAPVIATLMGLADIPAPPGMTRTMIGLLIGAPWGFYAVRRGRWI